MPDMCNDSQIVQMLISKIPFLTNFNLFNVLRSNHQEQQLLVTDSDFIRSWKLLEYLEMVVSWDTFNYIETSLRYRQKSKIC